MKSFKNSKPQQRNHQVDEDNDPRTPRERLIYPFTVERHEDGWAVHKSGKFVGPCCDYYDKDEVLIPLLDCLNRENAKQFA